jgi:hypothetical protein
MDVSERWQSIAPASGEPGQRRPAPDRRKKRQAVAVACVQCRNGKSKVRETLTDEVAYISDDPGVLV